MRLRCGIITAPFGFGCISESPRESDVSLHFYLEFKVADSIATHRILTDFDRSRIANLCREASMFQQAIERAAFESEGMNTAEHAGVTHPAHPASAYSGTPDVEFRNQIGERLATFADGIALQIEERGKHVVNLEANDSYLVAILIEKLKPSSLMPQSKRRIIHAC